MEFLRGALAGADADHATVLIPEELLMFMDGVTAGLAQPPAVYWDMATTAKEAYRAQVRMGLSGKEDALPLPKLSEFLNRGIAKLADSIARAFDTRRGVYPSYFFHDVTEHTASSDTPPVIHPTRWKLHTLPLFLEGIVHALRQERDPARARTLYRAVRNSPLFDQRLKMYRVCAPLAGESEEIGRCRVFTPGWLENESVWLHMEYKYLLELLRRGLVEEFYEDFFHAAIPFQPPTRYGRSVLENSSFLVSSAHPDPLLHGAGFVARLSGATAEFLHMWLWMTLGRQPFELNAQGRLQFRPAPVLAARLFDAKGRFQCTLLGHTRVTYHNPQKRPTFGDGAALPGTIQLIPRSGAAPIVCEGGVVPSPHAEQIRSGQIAAIDIDLLPAARPAAARRPRSASSRR
jgi:hypothetical protein